MKVKKKFVFYFINIIDFIKYMCKTISRKKIARTQQKRWGSPRSEEPMIDSEIEAKADLRWNEEQKRLKKLQEEKDKDLGELIWGIKKK